MKFKLEPGHKCDGDKILCINTEGWQPSLLVELAKILRFKAKLEDFLYPPPAKGRKKLSKFVRDAIEPGLNGGFKYTLLEICQMHGIRIPTPFNKELYEDIPYSPETKQLRLTF